LVQRKFSKLIPPSSPQFGAIFNDFIKCGASTPKQMLLPNFQIIKNGPKLAGKWKN
jgi:hypothetical protein